MSKIVQNDVTSFMEDPLAKKNINLLEISEFNADDGGHLPNGLPVLPVDGLRHHLLVVHLVIHRVD